MLPHATNSGLYQEYQVRGDLADGFLACRFLLGFGLDYMALQTRYGVVQLLHGEGHMERWRLEAKGVGVTRTRIVTSVTHSLRR